MKSLRYSNQFEKEFSTRQTFKRNKKHYDGNEIQSMEHASAQRRRRPIIHNQSVHENIEQRFNDSKKLLHGKLSKQTHKFKHRLSLNLQQQQQSMTDGWKTPIDTEAESASPTKISPSKMMNQTRGVPFEKTFSRDYYYANKVKPCEDERMFNNFEIVDHDLTHIPQISKLSPRKIDFALKNIHDLPYNTQDKYQEFYFKNSTLNCRFHLKKQRDDQGRKFFIPQRSENIAQNDLNPESVKKSFTASSPFKANKILPFFNSSARDYPSMTDMRNLSPNSNFMLNAEGRVQKPEVEFSVKNMRLDLLAKHMDEIHQKKKPYFERNQTCDIKFFKQKANDS